MDRIKKLKTDREREWWKFIRQKKREGQKTITLSVDGKMVEKEEEICSEVEKYWKNVMFQELPDIKEDILRTTARNEFEISLYFTRDEVEKYLKHIKNNKATGPDNILNEYLKEGRKIIALDISNISKQIDKEEKMPGKWGETNSTLLHKGGYKKKDQLKNYRPIAVTSNIGKVYCGLLKERIMKYIEDNRILSDEQNGFRAGRRGSDNIFIMNEIIEKRKKEKKNTYIAFLDIEKAYDSLNRELLWALMKKVGLKSKVIKAIKSLYNESRTTFKIGNIVTDWVESNRGVKQGCVLSPLIFALFMEELTTRVKALDVGVNIRGSKLSILLFADDVILVAESEEDLKKMLVTVGEFEKETYIRFSKEKSQIKIVKGNNRVNQEKFEMNGVELTIAKSYTYLGLDMNVNGFDEITERKIASAEGWVGQMGGIVSTRKNKYPWLHTG